MLSIVMSIPAQLTWELVCVPLSMLTFLDTPMSYSRPWRPGVEPEENMVDQTGKLLLIWFLVCIHSLFSGVSYDISIIQQKKFWTVWTSSEEEIRETEKMLEKKL